MLHHKKVKIMKLHHKGYITGNIDETAKAFEVLGYIKQPTFDDTRSVSSVS